MAHYSMASKANINTYRKKKLDTEKRRHELKGIDGDRKETVRRARRATYKAAKVEAVVCVF